MEGAEALISMLRDPAPGMRFAAHEQTGIPERVHRTPHFSPPPASLFARRAIKKLCRESPELREQLLSIYRRHDGVALCMMPDVGEVPGRPAITLLPVRYWKPASRPFIDGDMASALEGCPLYQSGTWRVIGEVSSESNSIILFFDGEYEGVPLAGRSYCVGLDGYLGHEEVLAESFEDLLQMLGLDIVGLIETIGYTWYVKAADGSTYGDVPSEYLSDVRGEPLLVQ